MANPKKPLPKPKPQVTHRQPKAKKIAAPARREERYKTLNPINNGYWMGGYYEKGGQERRLSPQKRGGYVVRIGGANPMAMIPYGEKRTIPRANKAGR